MGAKIFVNVRALNGDAPKLTVALSESLKAETFQSEASDNQRECGKQEHEHHVPIFLGDFRPHSFRRENHLKRPNHSRDCRGREDAPQAEIAAVKRDDCFFRGVPRTATP
jgi:hypothetical protein